MFTHQDWTPVVVRKKYTDVHEAQRDGKTVTKDRPVPKVGGQGYEKDLRTSATEEAPALKALPKLSQEDRQAMIQARVAKKWSQSDLAKQTNLRAQIIQDIESGKIIENLNHLQSINRALGTKIKASK